MSKVVESKRVSIMEAMDMASKTICGVVIYL